MEEQCVVAEYANYEKARVGLEVLDLRGFTANTVSVVSRATDNNVAELERARREKNSKPSMAASGGIGAAVASGAVAPIAVGTLLGPLFLIGPLAAAVAGAAAGSVFSGAKKLGMSEEVSQSYQQRIENGSVLILVHAAGDRLKEAAGGLKTTDTLSLESYAAELT